MEAWWRLWASLRIKPRPLGSLAMAWVHSCRCTGEDGRLSCFPTWFQMLPHWPFGPFPLVLKMPFEWAPRWESLRGRTDHTLFLPGSFRAHLLPTPGLPHHALVSSSHNCPVTAPQIHPWGGGEGAHTLYTAQSLMLFLCSSASNAQAIIPRLVQTPATLLGSLQEGGTRSSSLNLLGLPQSRAQSRCSETIY